MKLKIISLTICSLFILTACSDKKEEKVEVTPTVAGKIEVTQKNDIYEKKVEEKEAQKDRSYYYSYNKEKVKDIERTTLNANIKVRSPYEKVEISMLVGKLSKEFIVKCSACHNDYANGVIGPSLINKDEKFIYDSISSFKKDTNKNVLMSQLVKQMPEEEIKKLAKEIANFNMQIRELKAK
ncbi:MAG: c-type cytochrome [Arcobacter sp.]|uniref:c-type cytochrome n=1 Tax=Arcobacter sp. TaxID=1872629 RepID=UPI003B001DCB